MSPSPSPERHAAPTSSGSRPDKAALYTQLGPHTYRANPVTAGPWQPDAQHGSPVGAVLLHAMEQANAESGLPIARVTIELLRPVPVADLTIRASVRRSGRRVQLLQAEMRHEDVIVAAGSAWAVAGDATDVPGANSPPPAAPTATGHGIAARGLRNRGFHAEAVEADIVQGAFLEPGPAAGWIRLKCAVVAGHSPTPAQRALIAADFGNGFSSTVDPREITYINPDLTVYLSGTPQGDWVGLASTTFASGEGFGYAESILYDRRGVIGRAVQSLLFQRRSR